MNRFLDQSAYRIISCTFSLLGRLPRPTARRMAAGLGRLWFVTDRRHREVAMENLTLAFGTSRNRSDIRRLARSVFIHLASILFEIGWMMRLPKNTFSKHVSIYGLHYLQAAYKKGRGVLVLTGHVGNWELMSLAAVMLGYPMSAVYRPMEFKPLDRFFIDLRSRYGVGLHAKKNAMRPILKDLKNRELVGILLDQNTHRNAGVFVDFFRCPACTSSGLALLALKTESPVVPLFLMREGDRFRVEFGPDLPLFRTFDKERDILDNTRQYTRVIEEMIRRYPEQWFWVHRRWKTRPENEMSHNNKKGKHLP